MKQKINSWKETRYIFMVFGFFVDMLSMYFFIRLLSEDGFLWIFPAVIGIIIFSISGISLSNGYPVKDIGDIDDGTIKIVSLFKVETIDGKSKYIYEIEFKDGTTHLFKDKRANLENGHEYTVKRSEDLEKTS